MNYKDTILTTALLIMIFIAISGTITHYKATTLINEPQSTVIEFKPIEFTYIISEYKRADTLVFIYSKGRYQINEMFYDNKVKLAIKMKDTVTNTNNKYTRFIN